MGNSGPSYEKFEYESKLSYYNYYKQLKKLQNMNYNQNMYQMPSLGAYYTPGENYILCEIKIWKGHTNEKYKIINSYENYCQTYLFEIVDDLRNEYQIKNCTIYIDDKQVPFSYEYTFKRSKTYKIKFVFNQPLTNCSYMFYKCDHQKIDLSHFNTSYVTDMSYMFYSCSVTSNFNLSNLNTQNVHDMSFMFYNCSNVYKLDLSSFNTQNVINMTRMFSNCSKLITLILTSFNTYTLRYMANMFYNDFGLHNLDLSNFNTQNAVDMKGMFSECISLDNLNLSNFIINNTANIEDMFKNCKAFEKRTIIARDPTLLSLINSS